jgi:hypothetical protein
MRLEFLISLLFCFNTLVFSQTKSAVLESMALKDFKPSNKNIWWLKDMKGYMDHTHPIRMVIATDNKVFKGAYELINSGERFNLEGNFEGDEVVLIETDSLDRVTGYIKGDIIDDRFYAKWSDSKNFISHSIFVSSEPKADICGNLGWGRFYKNINIFQDSMVSIFISKSEDKYEAIISYKNSFHKANLEPEDESGYLLRYVPEPFSGRDEMILDIKNNKIKFLRSKIRKPIQLEVKKEVFLNCKSLINFDHDISYTYPIINDKKFELYIQTEFVNQYMDIVKESLKPHDNFSISERALHQEVGNFKFNYLNDTILSGIFFFQSSAHNQILELPLNYIFSSKKDYKFDQGFIDKYNFASDVKSYLMDYNSMSKTKLAFTPEDYKIFLFDREGIKCKTPFHIMYGEDEVIIPYTFFNSKIKKKSFYK